jgi:two-component system response regulator
MSQPSVGRRMEILLVEDTLEDARTTILALQNEPVDCRVSLVCDGEEAMKFLHREGVFARAPHPDLILLDMELPKQDGRQVLMQIRADEQLKSIPVIVLTASLVHRAVLQAQDLRVDGYMTKPVSLEQFVGTVKSLRRSWLAESLSLLAK